MLIGLINELPIAGRAEQRVALTPPAVATLSSEGHSVIVERGAGEGAGFSDDTYEAAGARVVYRRAEVVGRAEALIGIWRLRPEDLALMQPGAASIAFHLLDLAPPALRRAYAAAEIHAIGIERLRDANGAYPVVSRISELCGALAPQIAARMLESTAPGRTGIFLGRLPGVPPADVVSLGAGALGATAARAFAGVGCTVHLLDRELARRAALAPTLPANVVTATATPESIARAARFANVLVGAVREPGQLNDVIVPEDVVHSMRKGAAILDFSISEGGSVATSRPIGRPEDVYEVHGVLHFTMPNATTLVARTASRMPRGRPRIG